MHCWFCGSEAAIGTAGPFCPFRDCPAGKTDAGPLHDRPPERWRRMRQAGRLEAALAEAGLSLPAG